MLVVLGGFTTNLVWCLVLSLRHRTLREYIARTTPQVAVAAPVVASATAADPLEDPAALTTRPVPLLRNYLFSALAGTTWYLQFFFYTMGETKMGQFGFASWTLHMASIIIFSTMWGWILHEWKGSSRRAHTLIALGIATLVASTLVIGYGAYLKGGG